MKAYHMIIVDCTFVLHCRKCILSPQSYHVKLPQFSIISNGCRKGNWRCKKHFSPFKHVNRINRTIYHRLALTANSSLDLFEKDLETKITKTQILYAKCKDA